MVSNVIDTNTGKPAGNAAPYLVRTLSSLKVGFIGLCLTGDEISADRTAHLRFPRVSGMTKTIGVTASVGSRIRNVMVRGQPSTSRRGTHSR